MEGLGGGASLSQHVGHACNLGTHKEKHGLPKGQSVSQSSAVSTRPASLLSEVLLFPDWWHGCELDNTLRKDLSDIT